jgi:tripartite-type tricarboxylate transporter receptor subunit TctC
MPVVTVRLIMCALACAVAAPLAAQTWPARPVRIVVPYTPGGGIDTVARVLAPKLAEQLGGSFVVENRPGAAGVVGAEIVARAAPDGYTLLASATEFAINPAAGRKLPYDPFRDFTHISQLASVQFILGAHPSVPARNAKELIAIAKARPGELTYGSSGTGGGPHLAGELFQLMAGIKWTHVPFKGAQPAATAVLSGEIDLAFGATIGLAAHVNSGRMRAIGVTGEKRYPGLPNVPTIAESGLPGYTAIGWYGYYGPAGMAPELVRRIYTETAKALGAPDTKEKLAKAGNEYVMSPPEEFGPFLKAETAKWGKVARAANIKFE